MVSAHPRSLRLGAGFLIGLVAVGLLLLAPGHTHAQATPSVQIKQITLTPGEEVPPVSANVLGYFSATLRDGALDYDISGDGGNFTMAHLHLGAKGTNGPVVLPLFSHPEGQSAFHVTGTVTAANLTGPLAGDWNGFLAALARGDIYANAHTSDHPAGVMRAQLPATSLPSTPVPPRTGSGAPHDATLPTTDLLGIALLALAGGAATTFVVARRRR